MVCHDVIFWNARTRLQRSRTRVRLGRTRQRGRDTADRASVPRQAASCHMDSPTRADAAQIGPYRPNIGVFWPEKGNRPVRRKKNLKPKILVDLIRSLHRLNPFFFFFFASSSSSSFFFAALPFCSVADLGQYLKTSLGRIGL